MTTESTGPDLPPSTLRRKKQDRFRKHLAKQRGTTVENDNNNAESPVVVPEQPTPLEATTAISRPAMTKGRMKSARRSEELTRKRDKIIQKLRTDKTKRLLLSDPKTDDQEEQGEVELSFDGSFGGADSSFGASMMGSEGVNSCGASLVSDEGLDTSLTIDAHVDSMMQQLIVVDTIVQQRMVESDSDVEEDVKISPESGEVAKAPERRADPSKRYRMFTTGSPKRPTKEESDSDFEPEEPTVARPPRRYRVPSPKRPTKEESDSDFEPEEPTAVRPPRRSRVPSPKRPTKEESDSDFEPEEPTVVHPPRRSRVLSSPNRPTKEESDSDFEPEEPTVVRPPRKSRFLSKILNKRAMKREESDSYFEEDVKISPEELQVAKAPEEPKRYSTLLAKALHKRAMKEAAEQRQKSDPPQTAKSTSSDQSGNTSILALQDGLLDEVGAVAQDSQEIDDPAGEKHAEIGTLPPSPSNFISSEPVGDKYGEVGTLPPSPSNFISSDRSEGFPIETLGHSVLDEAGADSQEEVDVPADEKYTAVGNPPPPPPPKKIRSSRKKKPAVFDFSHHAVRKTSTDVSYDVVSNTSTDKPANDEKKPTTIRTPPPPPPPKKKRSSKKKQMPSVLEVSQNVTQESAEETGDESKDKTPPYPPPQNNSGSIPRQKTKAVAQDKTGEIAQKRPAETKVQYSKSPEEILAQESQKVNEIVNEMLANMGTPAAGPPLSKESGHEEARQEVTQNSLLRNAKKIEVDTGDRIPTGSGAMDEKLDHTGLSWSVQETVSPTMTLDSTIFFKKNATADRPFDEDISSGAAEIRMQMAAAKIVGAQLSPPSAPRAPSLDEIDMPMISKAPSMSFEAVADTLDVSPQRFDEAVGDALDVLPPPLDEDIEVALDFLQAPSYESVEVALDVLPKPLDEASEVALDVLPKPVDEAADALQPREADPAHIEALENAPWDNTVEGLAVEREVENQTQVEENSTDEHLPDATAAVNPNVCHSGDVSAKVRVAATLKDEDDLAILGKENDGARAVTFQHETEEPDISAFKECAGAETGDDSRHTSGWDTGSIMDHPPFESDISAFEECAGAETGDDSRHTSGWDTRSIMDHPPLDSDTSAFEECAGAETGDDSRHTSGWDTQSIMDHPPFISPSAVSDLDPSAWDASRVVFETAAKNSQDDIDIFDTASWAGTDTAFSEVTEFASNVKTDLALLIKDAQHIREDPLIKIKEDVSSKGAVADFVGEWSSIEGTGSKDYESPKAPLPLKDDDALLGDKGRQIGIGDPGSEVDGQLSQKERVEAYANTSFDYSTSDSEDDDEAEEVKEDSDEDGEEVPYFSHDADADSDVDESTDRYEAMPSGFLVSPPEELATTFDAAAIAADAAETESSCKESVTNENDPACSVALAVHTVQDAISSNQDIFGNVAPAIALQRETPSKSRGAEKPHIPLLVPPPEEKLKKWEESKLRPFKHLEAMQKKKKEQDVDVASDSQIDFDLFASLPALASENRALPPPQVMWDGEQNAGDTALAKSDGIHQEQRDRAGASSNDITNLSSANKQSVPLLARLDTQHSSDDAFVDDAGEVELLSKNSSCDKSVRADSGKIVLTGDKMAEKVDLAISVAAEMLEERLIAEKASASIAEDSKYGENIESDEQQNNLASLVFCGGAESFDKNILTNLGDAFKQNYPIDPPEDASEEVRNHGAQLVGGAFSSWKNGPLVELDSNPSVARRGSCDEVLQVNIEASTPRKNASMQLEPREVGPKVHAEKGRETDERTTKKEKVMSEGDLVVWLRCLLLQSDVEEKKIDDAKTELRSLLEDDSNFDNVCALVSAKVSNALMSKETEYKRDASSIAETVKEVVPFTLATTTQSPNVLCLAANFVSFAQRIGNLTGTRSPFKEENPFVLQIVGQSLAGNKNQKVEGSVQQLVFDHKGSDALQITEFFYDVVQAATQMTFKEKKPTRVVNAEDSCLVENTKSKTGGNALFRRRYETPPEESQSPFETATRKLPSVLLILLGFLGDPVAVCRMKMVDRFCYRIISENEHTVMRDAVRAGGMSMNVRPAFWMWVTLEKCGKGRLGDPIQSSTGDSAEPVNVYPIPSKIAKLAQRGREGQWHGVIERDVARAFGNMPPHKTGAKLRADSIVRALVTFGQGRLIKRGVKGGGFAPPMPSIAAPNGQRAKSKPRVSTAPPPWEVGDDHSDASNFSLTPIDTVSDWGGVSPVASFASVSSVGDEAEYRKQPSRRGTSTFYSQENVNEQQSADASRDVVEELVLNGNALTTEMKRKLQNQLEFILHALAAEHDGVGYCQGMDYIVAHLLRVLQDTVKWHAAKGWLPAAHTGADKPANAIPDKSRLMNDEAINESLVVEEAVFRVMDCLFTTYNLRHMYWPELRSLKIFCRVFELLVQHKLPVLADHFEHHELNVGLFALGWFQTLFLYLPSMPTATVCHIWDIWLVERSYKIFFRVGTAILFLSQPILLNHDLEGMMTYLNTFPDATLLKSDILIACALQIKVTNRMLAELEMEVTGEDRPYTSFPAA